jgi:hypothetical protein
MALRANEDARVKKKACNTDIEEEITGFKYAPDRVALPHARWCQNVRSLLCYVIFWMVDLYKNLLFFNVLGTTATNISLLASVLI